MVFRPEGRPPFAEQAPQSEKERARQKLAELSALTFGFKDSKSFLGSTQDRLAEIFARFPEDKVQTLLEEMQKISREIGWITAVQALEGQKEIALQIRRHAREEKRPGVETYDQKVQKPVDIQSLEAFTYGDIPTYWVPRKSDIRRLIAIAEQANKFRKKEGPIRIVDVGGGAGFLGKLIADEARQLGKDVEIVVIDPDSDAIQSAAVAYSDTEQITFQTGTAFDAFLQYRQEITDEDRARLEELEKLRFDVVDSGKTILKKILSVLRALENTRDPYRLLNGPLKKMASEVFQMSNVSFEDEIESIIEQLDQTYLNRQERLNDVISLIRAEQEKTMRKYRENTPPFDLTLNSWMPLGIDLTYELRWLDSPAIVYIKESYGATGVSNVNSSPDDIGKELSYRTDDQYIDRPDASWDGPTWFDASRIARGKFTVDHNMFSLQTKHDTFIPPGSLEIEDVATADEYPWEAEL